MGWCHLPPERVKLTVNTKKETNGRVKMGQGSRWASVIYPLKESKWAAVVYPLTESNWQWTARKTNSRVKMGQESKWVKLGLAHFDSESNWAKESRWVGTISSTEKKNVKQLHNQFLQLLSKSLVYTSTKIDIEMEILSDTEKALHQIHFISIHQTLENKSSWRKSSKNLISLLYLPSKLKGDEFMKEWEVVWF